MAKKPIRIISANFSSLDAKSLSVSNHQTRQLVCSEAARLMAEEGILDHRYAKSKAIERLNLPATSELPDNREIEIALIEYLDLFQKTELASRKKRWRTTALMAMKHLHEYEPRLTGSSLSGTLTRFSSIQILIQASPETVSIFLHDENFSYDQRQKRFRRLTKDTIYLPTFQFLLDELDIELLCVESNAILRTLACPISGKALRSGSYDEVEKLLSEN